MQFVSRALVKKIFFFAYPHRATGLFMGDKCSDFTVTAEKTTVVRQVPPTHKKNCKFKKKIFLNISIKTCKMCKAIF